MGGQGVGFGNGGDAEEVVKNRFLRFLLWQSVQSTVIYFLCKTLLLSPFTRNPFTPSFVGCLAFFIFHLSLLLFSILLFVVASPQRHNPGSPLELVLGLIRLIFVSGGQPPPPKFRQLAKISLTFLLFVTACTLSGFLSLFCLCWNFFDDSVDKKHYWRLLGNFGFRGLAIGFSYGLCYLYKKRWVLQFPIIQRPSFFSFKMGLPSATLQALKLSSAAYFFSSVLSLFLPCAFKGQITIGEVVPEQVVFYMTVVIFLCFEVNHHLHQVLHTRRFIFAPAKGSAAAETNPSEPLLAALEESTPRSLMQYLAYLDLCMVCESNVDIWRRAAFFEETGETYKRVMAVCLSPLEHFASKLGESIESSSVGKSFQVDHQLRLPIDSRLSSRLHDIFDDFQLCAWCARSVSCLTIHSHKEDRFGVAQLSGSNSSVISTLLCCLLAVETFMGKNNKLQCITSSSGIKWATSSTGSREASGISPAAAGRRGHSPLYSKAYCVADVLRTSIYCIVSAFHDEMLVSAKSGLLDKEWITSCKLVYGTRELLSHKLRLFLEFQAN